MPTLNKELILRVADEIERNGPDVPKFDMGHWINIPKRFAGKNLADIRVCQTAACIAGHVSLLHCPIPAILTVGQVEDLDHEGRATVALGLDPDQADALFLPEGGEDGRAFPRRRVAAVLRHLAETNGQVEWDGRERRRHARAKGDT